MVDSVGGKPFSVGDRTIGRAERVGQPRALETPPRSDTRAPATGPRSVARELAASPPVDTDRVARIRRAIAEGKFPISPATIADRLLALKMNWSGDEQA